ncbi:hypothetical protein [Blastopirellula marina]|uniref:Uncharacterized protein n=1 Tax=Blastopirellula marina TaxID=124 RepID=A0A2S8F4U7_9BACT|nr:hypothetical protein [Blastopirellula marina]PQO27181.1 hypothetical protein C5Y98_28465 [Blastopirellula marina]PTL41328.1 hypothetical protein C5Y97_28480 [Blastopirellula marina]
MSTNPPSRFRVPGPVFVSAAILLVLALIVPLPWVSWGSEVDIHSGQVRRSVWVVGMLVSRRVEETWISATASPLGEPEWRYAVTDSWWGGGHSHWRYHSAVHQIESLEKFWEEIHGDDAARQEAAEGILKRWQTGDDTEADQYVVALLNRVIERRTMPPEGLLNSDANTP